MKKYLMCFVFLLFVTGCRSMTMNDVIENEASITGIVKEVNDKNILVENGDGEYYVSRVVELADSYSDYELFDELTIYYDGNIAESNPMQINKVYAIVLKNKAPAVKAVSIDGKVYYDTGEVSKDREIDETYAFTIKSTVSADELSGKDEYSNFGTGYSYFYGDNFTVLVEIDNEWHIFKYDVKEDEIVTSVLAASENGDEIVSKCFKEDKRTYKKDNLYLVKESGEQLFLESVNNWEINDAGYFINGDIYVFTPYSFRIYVDDTLSYSLGDYFDLENNYLHAVQRIDDGFYIVYCEQGKVSAADVTYKVARIDRDGNVLKETDTAVYQQMNMYDPCDVRMFIRNGVISLRISKYGGGIETVNIDENSFMLID